MSDDDRCMACGIGSPHYCAACTSGFSRPYVELLTAQRDEARAEVERLQWAVVLLRAGAEDIARGDYANSLARRTAQQMLSDTNDPD